MKPPPLLRWLLAAVSLSAMPHHHRRLVVVVVVAAATATATTAAQTPASLEALDEAILSDILESFSDPGNEIEPSSCAPTDETVAATSFSFDWPGTNADSDWFDGFAGFEQGMFQAIMSHTDASGGGGGGGGRSWSVRIGTGGNMYSHYAPDMHGETFPPQNHAESPWIDEVQQSVSVNGELNQLGNNYDHPEFCPGGVGTCKKYYIHQAGAYMRDASPYTDVPFYSPSLARHCSGNSCSFASWGTQAHVATPFTSPIIYINKYTNCGGGVIEHTQMIHNFADPSDPVSTSTAVDQTFFNVGWGGVRSSSLPYAIEPDPTTGALPYADVNAVPYLSICPWGGVNIYGNPDHDGPGTQSDGWRGSRQDLGWLGGYTTFVEPRLLVNQTIEPVLPWCRDNSKDCFAPEPNGCMVSDCTDAQIASGEFTRLQLKVAANASPGCRYHSMYGDLITVQCDMRDTGFGRTSPNLSGLEPCSPWAEVGFRNTRTGEVLPVPYVRHWSWSPNNRRAYFAVYETNWATAVGLVNAMFTNVGYGTELLIDVVPTTANVNDVPPDYDPGALNSFSYIYGKGAEYGGNGLGGRSRRRIGSTQDGPGTRDYTVFTINWFGNGARLEAGSTYYNRGFYLTSDLGSVESTARELADMTEAEEIELERWDPRAIDLYQSGDAFAIVPAASARGASTTCGSPSAVLACEGASTPTANRVPFFYVTCGGGTSTYFGPNPYALAPPVGGDFPGHGVNHADVVRSYVCAGMDASIRPTWKLMGFFNPDDAGCASLATATYDDTVCDLPPITPSPTSSPVTGSPTLGPVTGSPTTSPTGSPVTGSPTMSPVTKSPTANPTSSPVTGSPTTSPVTVSPTKSPTGSPVTGSPTTSPVTVSPTTSPTVSPVTGSPTMDPVTGSPNTSPTGSPVTGSPTTSPVTGSPNASPTGSPVTGSPTMSPVTVSPTKSPTVSPVTGSPTMSPVTASPNASPTVSPVTGSPTISPVTASPTKSPTVSPVTGSPTMNPVTGSPNTSPTGSPVTGSPTMRPVTVSPTKSPVSPQPTPTTPPPTPAPIPLEPTITATFDGTCPRCTAIGGACTSGALLLNSRGNMGGTPEPNIPNTIDSCTDGSSGSYHSDESNDAIEVSAVGGGFLQIGRMAVAKATVWAWSTGSSDTADFYVSDTVGPAPNWVHIGSVQPPGGGANVLESSSFVLTSTLQAVRVNFRYGGAQSHCSGGSYDDADDLVFAVAPSGPYEPPTNAPTDAVTPTPPPTTADPTPSPTPNPTTADPTPWPATPNPTSTPCVETTVEINTGEHPDQTSWTLANVCTGETVFFGPKVRSPNTLYSNTLCLPPARYNFLISDAMGDGMTGSGYYEVTSGGAVVASGGQFGSTESTSFGAC